MGYDGILVSLVISLRTKDKKYNEIQWDIFPTQKQCLKNVQRKFGNRDLLPTTIGRLEY